MKKLLLPLFVLFTTLSFSQSISGIILDGELNDIPLSFAHISIDGTNKQTLTDFDGSFEFKDLSEGSYTITIQFLGYEPKKIKEIEVKSKETYRVSESLHSISLN